MRIEQYAVIGDLHTAALVGRNGSIDWYCPPRFDSPAAFAALLGNEDNGRWLIAPAKRARVKRSYREDTLVLETRFETHTGVVTLIDCMAIADVDGNDRRRIVRLVRGDEGSVEMEMDLTIRFDYGHTVPWLRRVGDGVLAVSGPNSLQLHTPIEFTNRDFHTRARFEVKAGEVVPFLMVYSGDTGETDRSTDPEKLVEKTTRWWQDWVKHAKVDGPWRDQVVRSLITLKALTHNDSGGIVAAATTSLPERIGGGRNWDYRYCWLRDATFTLYSLLIAGLHEEATAWRSWLLRVAAGMPSQLQAMFAPAGERLLPEFEVDWLRGYENSQPVRVGNAASRQLQIDVYGEILDVFHTCRRQGIPETDDSWALQVALVQFLETGWRRPDSGIWEVRGPERHFTHSKIMAWVGVDRAIRAVEEYGMSLDAAHLKQWKELRQEIHDTICREGYDAERNSFVQYFGAKTLDASLLLIPHVGFLPATDPRVLGTVHAIEQELRHGDFIRRYTLDPSIDGINENEGAFLPCAFWLVDNYILTGQMDKARKLFKRLLRIANDVGLLSEEYDPDKRRMLGNFPQAYSHVSLINTACNLMPAGPAVYRSRGSRRSLPPRRKTAASAPE